MKAVLQVVESAELKANGKQVCSIGQGLVVYLGLHENDKLENCASLAKKVANLRIFADEQGKINLDVKQAGNNILLVSNFTLYADTSRGNRPSFAKAMEPERANQIYLHFASQLSQQGVNVKTGVFGAKMTINQVCVGPVNIVLED